MSLPEFLPAKVVPSLVLITKTSGDICWCDFNSLKKSVHPINISILVLGGVKLKSSGDSVEGN